MIKEKEMLTPAIVDTALMAAMVLDSRDTSADSSFFGGGGNSYRQTLRELGWHFRKSKVKASSGVYRRAFIFKDFVLKVSLTETRINELISEYEFIKKMRADGTYGRHFPETHMFTVGNTAVMVQERINMSHRGKHWLVQNAVETLAEKLGIDDFHDGNYGWKGPKGKDWPVFIDVDFRTPRNHTKTKRLKKRSWMVSGSL